MAQRGVLTRKDEVLAIAEGTVDGNSMLQVARGRA